jgi:hypothetical protein
MRQVFEDEFWVIAAGPVFIDCRTNNEMLVSALLHKNLAIQ